MKLLVPLVLCAVVAMAVAYEETEDVTDARKGQRCKTTDDCAPGEKCQCWMGTKFCKCKALKPNPEESEIGPAEDQEVLEQEAEGRKKPKPTFRPGRTCKQDSECMADEYCYCCYLFCRCKIKGSY